MYECRATARRLLGERFKPRMREWGKIVQAVAKRDNCNEIVAGATVIKEAKLFGMDSLMLMAAVVELVEPSNAGGDGPRQAQLAEGPARSATSTGVLADKEQEMHSVKEGDVLKAINDAYRAYYSQTGRKPTRIYVGRGELDDLKRSTCAYVICKIGEQPPPMEVMGMQVFEVREQSHFYVC